MTKMTIVYIQKNNRIFSMFFLLFDFKCIILTIILEIPGKKLLISQMMIKRTAFSTSVDSICTFCLNVEKRNRIK